MTAATTAADLVGGPDVCTACSERSMYLGICETCGATIPTAPPPSEPLRFTDVLDELGAVADLASRSDASGELLATACRRLQFLVGSLRSQFLADIGAPTPGAAGMV